jgi:hypothetical protein
MTASESGQTGSPEAAVSGPTQTPQALEAAMAGIVSKNLCAAIQRSIDHAVKVFWNGVRVGGRPKGL